MGGILVAMVGYQMLHGGEHSPVQHPSEEDKQKSLDAALEVAITPLAMPILAGPGTVAAAMSFASGAGLSGFLLTVCAFIVLCQLCVFRLGRAHRANIGDNVIKVISRLMGLILAVIGMQMLIQGVGGAVSGFMKTGAG